MNDLILRAWNNKNTFFYLVLIPLSWLFSALAALRRLGYRTGLFKTSTLPVPVIIVGNINVGGSGKTPVVIWLVEQLQKNGYTPGVISRGYGAKNEKPAAVYAASLAMEVGDEPLLIARRTGCPVWIGRSRVDAGNALLRENPDCNIIISDDGLQHYGLQRDLEVAVVDADSMGAQHLLPAGPLRERQSRLESVDMIICHGGNTMPHAFSMQLDGQTFYNLANTTKTVGTSYFEGKAVKAIAGIGKPERFFNALEQLGLDVEGVYFEDHHAFTAQDVEAIKADAIVMTEKDAVKCQLFAQSHYWVLPVKAKMSATLLPVLLSKLKAIEKSRGT